MGGQTTFNGGEREAPMSLQLERERRNRRERGRTDAEEDEDDGLCFFLFLMLKISGLSPHFLSVFLVFLHSFLLRFFLPLCVNFSSVRDCPLSFLLCMLQTIVFIGGNSCMLCVVLQGAEDCNCMFLQRDGAVAVNCRAAFPALFRCRNSAGNMQF